MILIASNLRNSLSGHRSTRLVFETHTSTWQFRKSPCHSETACILQHLHFLVCKISEFGRMQHGSSVDSETQQIKGNWQFIGIIIRAQRRFSSADSWAGSSIVPWLFISSFFLPCNIAFCILHNLERRELDTDTIHPGNHHRMAGNLQGVSTGWGETRSYWDTLSQRTGHGSHICRESI